MGTYVSLHGRKFGIDSDHGTLIRDGVTDGVTVASTASTISNRGISSIVSTGAVAFTLAAPIEGCVKTVISNVVSTAARTVTLASGTFLSTAGSTQNRFTINNIGQVVQLEALSTALWAVVGNIGTVAFTTA